MLCATVVAASVFCVNVTDGPPTSAAVDPRTAPIVFSDPRFGGPQPDELRRLDLDRTSTFTARYRRDEGQTIVLYSLAGGGQFVARPGALADVRARFIPPGGSGRTAGTGATLSGGRLYDFERYEMGLSGHLYGCFVAVSPTSADVLVVNHCRVEPAIPDDAEVAATLRALHVRGGALTSGAPL